MLRFEPEIRQYAILDGATIKKFSSLKEAKENLHKYSTVAYVVEVIDTDYLRVHIRKEELAELRKRNG